jgi:hypothetical protein
MSYFSKINPETNEVLDVHIAKSKLWCEYHYGGMWVQTYKKTPNKNFSGIGWTYHPDKDNFSSPQPFPSWTLDDNCNWQPPVPHPSDDKMYTWNEGTRSWDEEDLLT